MDRFPSVPPRLFAVLSGVLFVGLHLSSVKADVPSDERVRVLETPKLIGDATLTDQNGATFRLSDLHGKVAFVLFGFTNCPDACPLSMERLRELQHTGQVASDKVAYVMISVDGERDTPPAMKAFLAK